MATVTGERLVRGAAAMRALGGEIAAGLRPGDVVLLHGDLGAGKTTLTQGIAAALGVAGVAHSPTFTLVTEHPATLAGGEAVTLYHLDLYRLDDPEELENVGWEELIAPAGGVTVVEWPERAGEWLPERYTLVSIAYVDADTREVAIREVAPDP
jgi:tRNA threonylcarbamoyladenosine biosynthesis protein TsaE